MGTCTVDINANNHVQPDSCGKTLHSYENLGRNSTGRMGKTNPYGGVDLTVSSVLVMAHEHDAQLYMYKANVPPIFKMIL